LEFGLTYRRNEWIATDREVVDVINNCDVKGAEAILERNKELFVALLRRPLGASSANAAFQVGMAGIEAAIRNPRDLVRNWYLEGDWHEHSDGVNCTWKQVAKKMIWGETV